MTGQLNWILGGMLLGLVFFLAILLVKPIGVSTQFVIFDGILWNTASNTLISEDSAAESGYSSTNAYLNKNSGKYAKAVSNPMNYSLLFVLSIVFGAFISAKTKGPQPNKQDRVAPKVWRNRFGDFAWKRYCITFLSGMLVLFGARLAGGCTSGHMMSGMMQMAMSGYLFTFFAFLTAIPTARMVYRDF